MTEQPTIPADGSVPESLIEQIQLVRSCFSLALYALASVNGVGEWHTSPDEIKVFVAEAGAYIGKADHYFDLLEHETLGDSET